MANKCKCGCGNLVKNSTSNGVTKPSSWCRGHHLRRKSIKKELRKRAVHARKFIPKIRSREWVEKVRLAQIGKKRSPHTKVTKRKISIAARRLWKNAAHRCKMSTKMRKLWLSPVYRAKVRKVWEDEDFKKCASLKKSRTIKQQYASGERKPPNSEGSFSRFVNCTGWIKASKGGRIFYRGSWEKFFIELLDSSSIVSYFQWQPFGIPYKFKGEWRTYFPDVLVVLKSGEKWLVEIKGEKRPETKAKFKAAYEYCEGHRYGWAVITEKPIQPLTEYLQ